MDPLANLITSIRNAEMAQHSRLAVPHSKLSEAVLSVLQKSGYIGAYAKQDGSTRPVLEITLVPKTLHSYRRISKPGRRMYTSAKNIPRVLSGLGTVIISTPEGVMSGQEAKKKNLGGEVLCEVY